MADLVGLAVEFWYIIFGAAFSVTVAVVCAIKLYPRGWARAAANEKHPARIVLDKILAGVTKTILDAVLEPLAGFKTDLQMLESKIPPAVDVAGLESRIVAKIPKVPTTAEVAAAVKAELPAPPDIDALRTELLGKIDGVPNLAEVQGIIEAQLVEKMNNFTDNLETVRDEILTALKSKAAALLGAAGNEAQTEEQVQHALAQLQQISKNPQLAQLQMTAEAAREIGADLGWDTKVVDGVVNAIEKGWRLKDRLEQLSNRGAGGGRGGGGSTDMPAFARR